MRFLGRRQGRDQRSSCVYAVSSPLLQQRSCLVHAHSVKDEEAFVRRRQLGHHKEFVSVVEKENLLETPLRYLRLTDMVDEWHR